MLMTDDEHRIARLRRHLSRRAGLTVWGVAVEAHRFGVSEEGTIALLRGMGFGRDIEAALRRAKITVEMPIHLGGGGIPRSSRHGRSSYTHV